MKSVSQAWSSTTLISNLKALIHETRNYELRQQDPDPFREARKASDGKVEAKDIGLPPSKDLDTESKKKKVGSFVLEINNSESLIRDVA